MLSLAGLAEPVGEKVDEAADLRGKVATMRVDRVDAAILDDVIVEKRDQLAGMDMRIGDEVRDNGDAETGAGGTQRRLWAVDLDRAGDADRDRRAIFFDETDVVVPFNCCG
jgi:hypothetical protein